MNQPVPIAPAPVGPRIRSAQIMRHGGRSVSRIRTRSSTGPITLSNGGAIGPDLPATTRCLSERDVSVVAAPALPLVAGDVAGAASIDSRPELGLWTDLSSIIALDSLRWRARRQASGSPAAGGAPGALTS